MRDLVPLEVMARLLGRASNLISTTLAITIVMAMAFIFGASCASNSATAIGSAPLGSKVVVDDRCVFKTAATLVKQEGNAVLEVWQLEEAPVLAEAVLPRNAALAAYRKTMIEAGANLRRPVADAPSPKNASEALLWQREAENAEVAFGGSGGDVRKIQCLEALLFAQQNQRYSQISQPTEFIASVLRKRINGRVILKAYLSGSDQMFPPKGFYGFDEVEADVADGWSFWFLLHNHTVQMNQGELALGTPTLSTSDADLHRGLAERLGVGSARITNGFFTAEIPAEHFRLYNGR